MEIVRIEGLSEECEEKLKEILENIVVDPLLKIPNRYFFHLFFKREEELCRRHNLPLSVLFIDADGLKRVNDRFGHYAGDLYLKRIVEVVKDSIRGADLLIRWGGDEFVVFLHADREGAEKVRERLYSCLEKESIEVEGTHLPLKASIGVASVECCSQFSLEELVDRADKDMLREKKKRSTEVRDEKYN